MKKILLFVCTIMLAGGAFAQSEIDRVDSDSSAIQFFKKHVVRGSKASNYNDFKITNGTEWKNFYNFNAQQLAAVANVLNYVSWAKTDLDGDGKNDLLINGYLSKKVGESKFYRLFVFLSSNFKNDGLMVDDFLSFKSSAPQYISIVDVDTSKYIQLFRWQNDLYKSEPGLPLRIDTLSFNMQMMTFVDYKQQVNPLTIKRVTLRELVAPAQTLEATVTNNNTRYGDFKILLSQSDNKKGQSQTAKISQDVMRDFLDITSRLKKYDVQVLNPMIARDTDHKKSIEIEYMDGLRLNIADADGASSFTLAALYTWFNYSINNVYEQINQQNTQPFYDPFGW